MPDQSMPVAAAAPQALAELEDRVRRDLALIDYPAHPWVPPRHAAGEPVLDVAIVGGGQGGVATAFGLLRRKIGNIAVFDRSEAGREGPWVTFARMLTLRTPKHVTGPDLGMPSLTPRAWFEARARRRRLGRPGQDLPPGLAGLSRLVSPRAGPAGAQRHRGHGDRAGAP